MIGIPKIAHVVPAGDIVPEDMILTGSWPLGIPVFLEVKAVLQPDTGPLEFHLADGIEVTLHIDHEQEVVRL